MKALINLVLFVFALLNASFIAVVLAEMVSLPVGIGAGLVTMVIEAIGIHFVRKAMAASAAHQPAGAADSKGQA